MDHLGKYVFDSGLVEEDKLIEAECDQAESADGILLV
jgi:hypothetical protein